MATYLYQNNQMEQDLLTKINDSAHKHYAGDIPPDKIGRASCRERVYVSV